MTTPITGGGSIPSPAIISTNMIVGNPLISGCLSGPSAPTVQEALYPACPARGLAIFGIGEFKAGGAKRLKLLQIIVIEWNEFLGFDLFTSTLPLGVR